MKLSIEAVLALSTLALAVPAFTQEVATYTTGYAVAVDIGGNVYTGSTGPSVSKTGGRPLALSHGHRSDDAVRALVSGRDGTVYAAGKLGDGGFVARLNAQGERVGWLDLSGAARGIGMDAAGAVYVAGDDFLEKFDSSLKPVYTVPLTSPASALAVRPDGSVFLAQASRLAGYSPDGQPVTEFDLGGGNTISGIALNSSGDIFLTGSTTSSWLPAARDALHGPSDAFVTKMGAEGGSAEWSVHVGGSGKDGGSALAVRPNGGLVLVGYTTSPDFPGLGAGQSLHGAQNGFIAELDAGGNLIKSSYVGETGRDRVAAVALDQQGKIHAADLTEITFSTYSLLEGPGAGTDSIVLSVPFADLIANPPVTITASSWISIEAAIGTTNNPNLLSFSFQANLGATRTGTISILNSTLTVTQTGASLVPAGLVTLVSSGLGQPFGIATDLQGDVYIADWGNEAVEEWTASTQQLGTLANLGYGAYDVSLDAAGDVFVGGSNVNTAFLQEWQASTQQLTTLYSGQQMFPRGISVDPAGLNVYSADDATCNSEPCNAVWDWTASAGLQQVVGQLYSPWKVAVDTLGNLFIADTGLKIIGEYTSTGQQISLANTQGGAYGVSVDVGENVYFLDASGSSTLKKWSPSAQQVTTMASNISLGYYTAVDTAGNVYLSEPFSNVIQELPRAYVSPGPFNEGQGAGSDSIQVLPASQNLTGVYAPRSSDPSWLTIQSASNGVVQFSFTANPGNVRTATITVLGVPITVTQAALLIPQTMTITAGNNQSGANNQPFPTNLQVSVYSQLNTPVPGVQVQFFSNGAATFGTQRSSSYTATTDSNGLATAVPLTPAVAGPLTVTATLIGTSLSQNFSLTVVTQGIGIVAGNNQGVLINQAFPTNLKVVVYDQNANPVSGVTVNFSVPGSGASGSFSSGGSSVNVPTGADGTATAPVLTANGTAGIFAAYASASPLSGGSTTSVSFNLTNYMQVNIVAGNNQSASLNSVFGTNLTVLVLDQNANPAPGVQVTFTVNPGGGGASGIFAGSAAQAFVTTGSDGTAVAPALTANSSAGAFAVVASAAGLNSQTFVLTNVVEGFAYGGNQTGVATRTLPQPFIVQATAGATSGTIVYTAVPNGGAGGSFNGAAQVTVNTDAQGYGTSPQLTANGTPGTFTVTAYDGITTASTNVTSVECMNPANQTVIVGDTSDSSTDPGSLRYAVTNACAGSIVDLTHLTGSITLGSRLRIDDSLTLNGPGETTLAIDGGKTTRLFFIGAGAVAINDLTLQNGLGQGFTSGPGGAAAGMGGAIFMNGGSVTVSGVVFSGNEAVGGTASNSSQFSNGGAGFGGNPGNLTYQYQGLGGSGGDLFGLGGSANSQIGIAGGPGAGGGGGSRGNGGNGGFAGGGGAAAITGQTFTSGAGGFGAGGGGGFAPSPNIVSVQPGSGGFGGAAGFLGDNSTAPIGGGGAGFGGAIFEFAGTLTLQNDQFLNNSAVGGTGGYTGQNNGQGKGGALFIYNGATAVNDGSTFGTGTGAANIAADAGSPGIGSSAAPYTTGATCPGQDTADVCGTLTAQQTPTVSLTGPSQATYNTVFNVVATTTGNSTATISASGPCQLGTTQGTTTPVTMTSGTGVCQIQAAWPATPQYSAASATLNVNAALATPTVTFTGAPAQAAYLSSFTIAATTNASTTAVISASGPCSISGSLVTVTAGSGTCSLAANWLADMNYTSATANQSTVATKGATVVTVTNVNPASESYGSATPTVVTATLTWSANSGAAPTGGLTFKSTGSGPFVGSPSCSSTNSTTLTCTQTFKPAAPSAPVTYTLSASYSGDANYNSASSTQTNNFMITQQTPTVSITSVTPSSEAYGSGTPTQVTASLSWSGSGAAPTAKAALLNFSSTGAGAFGPVVCSGSNPKSCQVQFTPTATDKVSGYTITASYAGDRNYTAAHSTQTGNFTITPDTPAVTVTPNPATITHGSTAPVTLTATFTGVGANDAAPSGTVKFGAGSGTFSGQTCSSSGDVLTCTVSYTPSGKLAVGTYNNYLAASITAAGDYKAVTGYANLVVIK